MTFVPKEIKQISEYVWELPTSYKKGMKVPARIIASKALLHGMDNAVFEQLTNVACLPGLKKTVYALADSHSGYGAPIGCVAPFELENGFISPGMAGFDLNCGMRLVLTPFTYEEVKPKLTKLVDTFFKYIPTGVGCKGFVKLNKNQFNDVMQDGTKWCVDNGYGAKSDIERTESGGRLSWADPSVISQKAASRGINQLGTLGSGNHYCEIQVVKKNNIYDEDIAKNLACLKIRLL